MNLSMRSPARKLTSAQLFSKTAGGAGGQPGDGRLEHRLASGDVGGHPAGADSPQLRRRRLYLRWDVVELGVGEHRLAERGEHAGVEGRIVVVGVHRADAEGRTLEDVGPVEQASPDLEGPGRARRILFPHHEPAFGLRVPRDLGVARGRRGPADPRADYQP